MSIAEELHKTIDVLSEEQQQELLETARQLLEEKTKAEEDNPEYQALLKELLTERYKHHKAHPEKAVSLDVLTKQMEQRYGRRF